MTKEVQAYIKFWTAKKVQLEREIATKKRTLEQVNDKLSDPEFHLGRELKRGAVKVSRALGVEPEKKVKTDLRKKSDAVAAAEHAAKKDYENSVMGETEQKEEEKSSWSFFR